MRRIFGKRPHSLVGFDIGSAWVKLVELSRDDAGRCQVETFGAEPLPPNAVADHDINDVPGVAAAIKRLSQRVGTRRRDAATAVGGASVFTKVVELDASLSDAELAERAIEEAARHIPFPLAEVALDFEVQHLSEDHPDQVKVLLAACRSDEVAVRQAALELGGQRAKVVDLESLAAQRAFERIQAAANGGVHDAPAALIDIGFTTTKVSIFVDGKATHTRELGFGARQLGDDLRPHGGSPTDLRHALPEDCAAQVLEPFAHSLAERIERAVQLGLASDQHAGLGCVFLAGGMATLTGLASHLRDALATPVAVANPFLGMARAARVDAAKLDAAAPALALACGLALAECPR